MVAARTTDPTTSHTAAQINPNDLDLLRATILRTIARRPKTGYADHELVAVVAPKTRRTPQRIRTARADLAKLGLVVRSGETRKTESNYAADVWVIA